MTMIMMVMMVMVMILNSLLDDNDDDGYDGDSDGDCDEERIYFGRFIVRLISSTDTEFNSDCHKLFRMRTW